VIVGTPVGDGLLDGFGLEVLGEGPVDESWELGVGGEAEGDELPGCKFVDVGELIDWEKRCEAEALFKADDAVLQLEVVDATFKGKDQKGQRDEDRPMAEPGIFVAEVDGDVDSDSDVYDEDREDIEVHGCVEARVIAEVLLCRH